MNITININNNIKHIYIISSKSSKSSKSNKSSKPSKSTKSSIILLWWRLLLFFVLFSSSSLFLLLWLVLVQFVLLLLFCCSFCYYCRTIRKTRFRQVLQLWRVFLPIRLWLTLHRCCCKSLLRVVMGHVPIPRAPWTSHIPTTWLFVVQ